MECGIVGLPNVGKSTTFNTLSNLSVPAENYPFCTIDPTEAKIYVPDKRFERLCDIYNPKSKVAASISIFDIERMHFCKSSALTCFDGKKIGKPSAKIWLATWETVHDE